VFENYFKYFVSNNFFLAGAELEAYALLAAPVTCTHLIWFRWCICVNVMNGRKHWL